MTMTMTMTMTMNMTLTYEARDDVWTIRPVDVRIETAEDLEQWRTAIDELLVKLGGERVYIMICVDGFHLDPAFASEYGAVAKRVLADHALGLVRYGSDTDLTFTAVRLGAVLNRFPANIFPDRRHALEAVRKIRQLPLPGGARPSSP